MIRAGWGIGTDIYHGVSATRSLRGYLASLHQGAQSGDHMLPVRVMLCPSGSWLSLGCVVGVW